MMQINDLIEKEKNYICSFPDLINSKNNLGCTDGKIIGTGRSDYTQDSTIYNLSISGKTFSLIDIPGIEGDESKFEKIIRSSLDKAHTIFYVNGSGKKIEKDTLEKIKKYMHDGTSVYAVFNVHCKPKKERKQGIDKMYSDELQEAYKQYLEIVAQTEKELKSFLGDNYKGGILVNGLLSFCGLAFDSKNLTSIVYDTNKTLRSDQKKYLKEYNGNCVAMIEDSHISQIQEIIDSKTACFDRYIYDENIKKLRNRLFEMIEKISMLKVKEAAKIKSFFGIYEDFEHNCRDAKEDYIHSIKQIGYHAALYAFSDIKSELFDMLEQSNGKIKKQVIQQYFDDNKNKIINDIQTSINDRMEQLGRDYEESIEDAVQRMDKDFDREQFKFQISLSKVDISISNSSGKILNKYNLKAFGDNTVRVASLAFSGFSIGSLICPGIGSAVGTIIGTIVGAILDCLHFIFSKGNRIDRAKEQLQQVIDDQIDLIDDKIRNQLREMNFEDKINESFENICHWIDTQKTALNSVNMILSDIKVELKRKYKELS